MTTNWKTPDDLFRYLDDEFHFTLDACAAPWNHQCSQYFDEQTDGLRSSWFGTVWCNPPFDARQHLWIRKAYKESLRGITSVVLCPGQYYDTDAWHSYALKAAEIRYSRRRPVFIDPFGKKTAMRCLVLVFRPGHLGSTVATGFDHKNK